MRQTLNPYTYLWALGVIQPARVHEIIAFVSEVYPEYSSQFSEKEIGLLIDGFSQKEYVLIVREAKEPFYALTAKGTSYLPRKLRLLRDRARLFLLKDAKANKVDVSCGGADKDLDGAAPSVDTSTNTQGPAANKAAQEKCPARSYWPRLSKQFSKNTGPDRPPHDELFPLLSFSTAEQLRAAASGWDEITWGSYSWIGLVLGISPRLLVDISRRKKRHYRSFSIKKRGGGSRDIDSPRLFLKVVQWFIADYLLHDLPVHNCVHSFRRGRSICSNAGAHLGRGYVANIDIVDFFGSIKMEAVAHLLQANGFEAKVAIQLADLCTKDERLPQGAPTSPQLSNAMLYSFDEEMTSYCESKGMAYTRYADDITVSADDSNDAKEAIGLMQQNLATDYGLRLNDKKTRIASSSGQQKVTGVVVNEKAQPPRKFRRQVRAAFHRAAENGSVNPDQVKRLRGYLSYLNMFPALHGSRELKGYDEVLRATNATDEGAPVEDQPQ